MNTLRAIEIVEAIADGVNPLDQSPLEPGELCLDREVMRAMTIATVALRRLADSEYKSDARREAGATSHGQIWNREEDQERLAQYGQGLTIREIATAHGRTFNAIRIRLEMHDALHVEGLRYDQQRDGEIPALDE